MRTNIPAFRLPESVLMEEIGYILDMGVDLKLGTPVNSMTELLGEGYDAVFVGTGAPKGKNLVLPGREEADANIHIGIDFLESVAFEHTDKIGKNVLIIGVGNTAMDCCRTSLRLGAKNVKVMARKPRDFFKASPWELEDAEEENVDILVNHSPKAFIHKDGKLTGMIFDLMEYDVDETGKITDSRTVGETVIDCDDVILAIGQNNAFPWIEKDCGIEFDKWDVPVVDKTTFESTKKGVFFGGDAAFGPLNIIWAVEHGHQAAISIHKYIRGESLTERRPDKLELNPTKMGMFEWGYSNTFDDSERRKMDHVALTERFKEITTEVEIGYTPEKIATEVQRCLNCDVHTVFDAPKCTECDACIDICPVECLSIEPIAEEAVLRDAVNAAEPDQALYVSDTLPLTSRVMIKDENVCLHCGLCAERCPTAAWDMLEGVLTIHHADKQDNPEPAE